MQEIVANVFVKYFV